MLEMYPRGYDRPIASAAVRLLDTIVSHYGDQGVELPGRRYVATGSVAVDTAQLTVMFGGIYVGPPGNELTTPYPGESPRSMSFNVELWRHIPALGESGMAPSADEISAASEILMHDSWMLVEAAYLFDSSRHGIIANAGITEPQGELAGVSMTIEVQVS